MVEMWLQRGDRVGAGVLANTLHWIHTEKYIFKKKKKKPLRVFVGIILQEERGWGG